MKNPVNLLPVSAAVAVATSAVLLLASAGSAFAANSVAEAGAGATVGGSVESFLPESWVPCTPAAAQSLFAIQDATAKGALSSDAVSKPCAQSAPSALQVADLSLVNPVG